MKKVAFLILIMMVFATPVMAETLSLTVTGGGDQVGSDLGSDQEGDVENLGEAPAQAMGSLYETEVAEIANEPGNQISELNATVNPQVTD